MGERKVLNKYYSPDFDPSFVPRRKKPKNEQIEVRMMLPMSIQCATCGEFMYRGKKFNSKKEEVLGERYHGIVIWRFYIKCSVCNAEISFKTDPANTDYVAESGCTRNFEPWRENSATEKAAEDKRDAEEEGDKMKTLENRTLDSRLEMEAQDQLDELRSLNTRHERVDTAQMLRLNAAAAASEQGGGAGAGAALAAGVAAAAAAAVAEIDEEEAGVAAMTFRADKVRRLADSGSGSDDDGGGVLAGAAVNLYEAAKAEQQSKQQARQQAAAAPVFQVKLKKRKRVPVSKPPLAPTAVAAKKAPTSALGGLAAYGSDSSSSD